MRDKLFLFDIDGTLILTGGAGLRALDRAVHELCGVAGACAGIRADGKTDPAIVLEIFEALGRQGRDGEAEAILERYLLHLGEEVASSRYDVMPAVYETLDLLERRGAVLGLATGNVERGAEIKLTRGDLWRRFAFGGYGSDSHDRGELVRRAISRAEAHAGRSFDRRDVWVIGDTPRDVAAAHAAGAMAIGVATGSHKPDALRDSGADVVWETLAELPRWLD